MGSAASGKCGCQLCQLLEHGGEHRELQRFIARAARRASHRLLKRELEKIRSEQRELGQDEDDFDFLDDDDDEEEEE